MSLEPSSLDARQDERKMESDERQRRAALEGDTAALSTTTETFALSPGDRVHSSDGRELGSVRSVKGGYFDLDCDGDAQFWLSSAYIAHARDGRVDLTLTEEGVGEHRLQRPGLETVDRNLAGTGDRVQTNMEALQTRERIEQELLEQRGTIDTGLRENR